MWGGVDEGGCCPARMHPCPAPVPHVELGGAKPNVATPAQLTHPLLTPHHQAQLGGNGSISNSGSIPAPPRGYAAMRLAKQGTGATGSGSGVGGGVFKKQPAPRSLPPLQVGDRGGEGGRGQSGWSGRVSFKVPTCTAHCPLQVQVMQTHTCAHAHTHTHTHTHTHAHTHTHTHAHMHAPSSR